MAARGRPAFTLIELLVVVAIIAILTGISFPVISSVRKSANRTQAANNLRQLASGLLAYTQDNDQALPAEGDAAPTWASTGSATNATAWFNVIPQMLTRPALMDFTTTKAAGFYDKNNLLFVPGAPIPTDKSRPYFTVSICSKFRQSGVVEGAVRLSNMQFPAETVLFQESGITGEKVLPGQKSASYDGQSKSFASRTVARVNGSALVVFGDGHVAAMKGGGYGQSRGKRGSRRSGRRGERFTGRSIRRWTPTIRFGRV